jgi:ABC-type dipeptide/oligopeptide/nickel transport system permease component
VALLLRRMLGRVLLVVLAASLAYLLAAVSLRPRANFEGRNPRPPQQAIEAELTAVNLNDRTPLLTRYAVWAAGVVRGDFGRTWDGGPVGAEMRRRAGVSLRLLTAGTLLGGVLGVTLGAYGAVRRHRLGNLLGDRLVTVLSSALMAVPVLVLAALLQIGAQRANSLTGMRIFEYVGETGAGGGADGGLGGRLRHLMLPTATIALGQIAVYGRYQRGVLLDVLSADFVRAARARGLRRRTVLVRHALRPALIPVATYLSYNMALVLTGAALTEKFFGWHGMGEWLIDSITRNDVNVVAAIGCCTALLVLLAGLLSDALSIVLDPRVRA